MIKAYFLPDEVLLPEEWPARLGGLFPLPLPLGRPVVEGMLELADFSHTRLRTISWTFLKFDRTLYHF